MEQTWTPQGDLLVNTVAVRRKSDHRTFAPHTCHIYKSEQKEYEQDPLPTSPLKGEE